MPKLQIKILEDKQSLGRTTAEHAARSLRVAIRDRGLARIIAGASQFEFLEALTRAPDTGTFTAREISASLSRSTARAVSDSMLLKLNNTVWRGQNC
jgi:hypothetical protein